MSGKSRSKCIAPGTKWIEQRCEHETAKGSRKFCKAHLPCQEKYALYKNEEACGDEQGNPNYRDMRCSTIQRDIQQMNIRDLGIYMANVKSRLNKVILCQKRMQTFWDDCVHEDCRDPGHVNVRLDLQQEQVVCQNLKRVVSERLQTLHEELKLAKRDHEDAKRHHEDAVEKIDNDLEQVRIIAGNNYMPTQRLADQVDPYDQIQQILTEPEPTNRKKKGKAKKNTKGVKKREENEEDNEEDAYLDALIKQKAKEIAGEIWAVKDNVFPVKQNMSREQVFFQYLETLEIVGVRNLEDLEAQDVTVLETLLDFFKSLNPPYK